MLTKQQTDAARILLEERPPVIPGTNVIPNNQERNDWYLKVNRTMWQLKVADSDRTEFCDVAGVAN